MTIKVGDTVSFLGYSDTEGMDDEDFILEEGDTGTVTEIDKKEKSYVLEVANPKFDSNKRASKANPKTIEADAFFEEVELVGGEEEQEEQEEAKPKRKAATKKKAAPKKKAAAKKKSTAKKKTKAKPEVEEEEDTTEDSSVSLEGEDEDILNLVEGLSDEELLDLAEETVEESGSIEWKLGGILFHVRATGAYTSIDDGAYAGKGGFEAYCNDELDIEYRKAMYLEKIYVNFTKAGLTGENVRELGWTKCKDMANVITEDNADALLEAAAEQTNYELRETIKEDFVGEKGATKTKAKKRITFKFRLFEDQAPGVEQIITMGMESLGISDMNQMFEHIVTEWGTEHLDVRAQQKSSRKTKAKAKSKATASAKKKVATKKKAPAKKTSTRAAPVKKKAARKKVATRRK